MKKISIGSSRMLQEFSDREYESYPGQIALNDIGYKGQQSWRNARACIIGMGGLGSLIALKLVGMGTGYLRAVHRYIVSRSDLHKQYLYACGFSRSAQE